MEIVLVLVLLVINSEAWRLVSLSWASSYRHTHFIHSSLQLHLRQNLCNLIHSHYTYSTSCTVTYLAEVQKHLCLDANFDLPMSTRLLSVCWRGGQTGRCFRAFLALQTVFIPVLGHFSMYLSPSLFLPSLPLSPCISCSPRSPAGRGR